jgi:hypothetical protein
MEMQMITAIVLYNLPPDIGLEACRAHFAKIAPDFMPIPGFVRKQFICSSDGRVAGGVYMWESRTDAERFYTDPGAKESLNAIAMSPAFNTSKLLLWPTRQATLRARFGPYSPPNKSSATRIIRSVRACVSAPSGARLVNGWMQCGPSLRRRTLGSRL